MIRIKINHLFFLLIPVLFLSCYKETNDSIDQIEKFYLENAEASAQVKFIHAYTPLTINSLNTASVGFRLTMDGIKLNGATGTSTSTNTFLYGGLFPPTNAYSFLPPGVKNFKLTLNRITAGAYAPVAGDEIFSTTQSLTAGKKYSLFIADPYSAPGALLIEDNFQEPLRDKYGIRFVNVCGDPASRFDIVSLRFGKIFTDVGYKEMKNYIYLDVPAVTDTIYLRTAGTTTVISQVNAFTAGAQRVYTFYARGKTGVTGRLPNLTFYTNR